MREQQRAGPAASGRRRRLRARMAPTDHYHLEARRCRRPDLAARPAVAGARRRWQRQAAAAAPQEHGSWAGSAGAAPQARSERRGLRERRGRRPGRLPAAARPGSPCGWKSRAVPVLTCPRPAGGRSRPGAGKRSRRIGGRPQLYCCCRSYPVPGLKLARRETSCLRPARRVSFPRGGALLGRGTRPKPEAGTPLLAGPRAPCCWCGEGAAAMDAAGGRGARARRGTRSTAPRSRGTEKGAARSPSRGRVAGEGSSAIATLRTPRTDGAPARGGRSARRAPAAREPPAGGAAGGAEAPPSSRSRAPAARVPAAPRSVAAAPDGAVVASGRRPPPAADALRLREVLSRLSLLREEVSEASTLVNTVVPHLVQAIRDKESCFSSIEQKSAGSYYERVKVGAGAEAALSRRAAMESGGRERGPAARGPLLAGLSRPWLCGCNYISKVAL